MREDTSRSLGDMACGILPHREGDSDSINDLINDPTDSLLISYRFRSWNGSLVKITTTSMFPSLNNHPVPS